MAKNGHPPRGGRCREWPHERRWLQGKREGTCVSIMHAHLMQSTYWWQAPRRLACRGRGQGRSTRIAVTMQLTSLLTACGKSERRGVLSALAGRRGRRGTGGLGVEVVSDPAWLGTMGWLGTTGCVPVTVFTPGGVGWAARPVPGQGHTLHRCRCFFSSSFLCCNLHLFPPLLLLKGI